MLASRLKACIVIEGETFKSSFSVASGIPSYRAPKASPIEHSSSYIMDIIFRTTALLSLLLFAGCDRATPTTAASTEEIPKDLIIVLERDVCFGTCPAYKLTITANGAVEFEGRHFVKKKGIERATISREAVKQLIAE